jgi:hypothetical protein
VKLRLGFLFVSPFNRKEVLDMLTREEAKIMVADGDIDLDEYRDFYFAVYQVACPLGDDEMVEVIRQSEDDQSPEQWAKCFQYALDTRRSAIAKPTA